MAENLIIENGSKEDKYQVLLPQAHALIAGETDIVAALANLSAALASTFGWLWTGFYLVKGEQLVLGPFQGPIACTRIPKGRGVCGSAWAQNRTLLVDDVDAFPGHIACSSSARSEVVVPIRDASGKVAAVLDIDSDQPASFDQTDAVYLERIVAPLAGLFDPAG
ncbi:GAF domain-containing protein [Chromobacterium violaceum]|uniref:GAF domain-containing protein n=1 Tax=Chromobacterium violaceum TaxID=536 RepID=UPI0009D9154D|nr:GAF domain-containing protein [Chromobacterium violaceum]MBP4049647.1 GAF domain-containing protein [Chromobacterium violaceum]OQS28675.1 diguanylate cyclase [Chromobacterium violaceum]